MNEDYRSFIIEYDYYSGGMVMPDRSFSYGNYVFGFNGKPKDDEVKGDGNSYDFGERIYDPRTNVWFSMDPIHNETPSYSPYLAFGNNPILYVDPDGRDNIIYLVLMPSAKEKLTTAQVEDIISNANKIFNEVIKLNVKVVLYHDEVPYANGPFDIKNIDRSDAVAVIGNPSEVEDFAITNKQPKWITDQLSEKNWGNQLDISEQDGIIPIKLDLLLSSQATFNASSVGELGAWTIVHGAGHIAGIDHPQGDLSPYAPNNSLMSSGAFITAQVHPDLYSGKGIKPNPDFTALNDWFNPNGNDWLTPLFNEKFDAGQSQDNYSENKQKSEDMNLIEFGKWIKK